MLLSRIVIRASAAGRTFASSTSSTPDTQLSTAVSSLITVGRPPDGMQVREPGAGQFELTARIRLFPTTHPE
jgi:hypothetical protein